MPHDSGRDIRVARISKRRHGYDEIGQVGDRVVRRQLHPVGDLIVAYNTDALGVFEQRTAGGLALWIAAAAVATLITGAVSWFRFKDRSVVVIVATIYAVLATALLAMGAIPEN